MNAKASLSLLLCALCVSPAAEAREGADWRQIRNLGDRPFSQQPLVAAADLRSLFRQRPADVREVLERAGWPGDPADLLRAVEEGEIGERLLPVGGKLQWMAYRTPAKVDVHRRVIWAGEEPVEAFELVLISGDWRWKFLVPKECGNLALFSRGGTAELTVAVSSGLLRLTDPEERKIVARSGESATVSAPATEPVEPRRGEAGVETSVGVEEGTVEFRDYGHPISVVLETGDSMSATVNEAGLLALSVPGTNPGPLAVQVGDAVGTLSAGAMMAADWSPPVCSLTVSPRSDCPDQPFAFDASGSSAAGGAVNTLELEIVHPDGRTETLAPEREGSLRRTRAFFRSGTYRARAVAISGQGKRSRNECAAIFEVRSCPLPPGGDLLALALDPRTPGVLYAGTQGSGVFKTTDGGDSWQGANQGLTDLKVEALAMEPLALYAGTFGGGVFKSTDGGADWRAVNQGLSHRVVVALGVDPLAPGTLYAGTLGGGVFKSTDGGGHWTASSQGLDVLDVEAVAIDPRASGILYAGTLTGGVFKSTDGGGSWKSAAEGLGRAAVTALAVDPLTPETLYAGTAGGIYKSTDGGGRWRLAVRGLENTEIHALAIDARAPTTLYAGTSGGVFKSTDGGADWRSFGNRLSQAIVPALGLDASGTLYAGTFGGGVFKSSDGGATWMAVTWPLPSPPDR